MSRFFMSEEKNTATFKRNVVSVIVGVALLIALNVILTRFLSISTTYLRIGFGVLPVAIAGIAYGPLWGGVCGAVGDLLGMMIFPTGGDFFPGFTLTAFLTGFLFGIFLHRRYSVLRLLLACLLVCIALNLVLDTLWLVIMYGSGALSLLPARIVKCVINIPVYALLTDILWRRGVAPFLHTERSLSAGQQDTLH